MTIILKTLERFGSNRGRTGEYLGVSVTALWRRLHRM
ncbi:helix-turn-helix domain-containing protein [Haliea sp. E1-2-M8]